MTRSTRILLAIALGALATGSQLFAAGAAAGADLWPRWLPGFEFGSPAVAGSSVLVGDPGGTVYRLRSGRPVTDLRRGTCGDDGGYTSSGATSVAASSSTIAVRIWCSGRYGASDAIEGGPLGVSLKSLESCALSDPAVDETTIVWWRGVCEPATGIGDPGRVSTAGAALVHLRDGVAQTLVGTSTPDSAPGPFLVAAAGGRVIALNQGEFTFLSTRTGKGVRQVPALPGASALALGPLGTVAALTGKGPGCRGISVLALSDPAWRTLPGCFTSLAATFGAGRIIVGERGLDGHDRLSDLDPARGSRHEIARFPALSKIEGVAAGGGLAAATARGCASTAVLTFSLRHGGRPLSSECPVRLRTRVLRLSRGHPTHVAFICPRGCPNDLRVVLRDGQGRKVGAGPVRSDSKAAITLSRTITRGTVNATWRDLTGNRRSLSAKVQLRQAR